MLTDIRNWRVCAAFTSLISCFYHEGNIWRLLMYSSCNVTLYYVTKIDICGSRELKMQNISEVNFEKNVINVNVKTCDFASSLSGTIV